MDSTEAIAPGTRMNASGHPAPVATAVLRAVSALQHGEAIVIEAADGSLHAAIHADAADAEALLRLRRLAGCEPVPALASAQARALGLRVDAPSDKALLLAGSGRALTTVAAPPGSGAAGAVDLARLARLRPALLVASLRPETASAADMIAQAGLLTVRADEIAACLDTAWPLRRVADARVPLLNAENTRIVAFRPADGGPEHMAIIVGAPDPGAPVTTVILRKSPAGDLLSSLHGDHEGRIRAAIEKLSRSGGGVLLYLSPGNHGSGRCVGALLPSGTDRHAAEMLDQLGFTTARHVPASDEDFSNRPL